MTTKFYSSLSNAKRAAKAAGLDISGYTAVQGPADEEGRRGWALVATTPEEEQEAQLEAEYQEEKAEQEAADEVRYAAQEAEEAAPVAQAGPVTNPTVPVAVEAAKLPGYKQFAVSGLRSSRLNPVKFVHSFLDENKGMTRKEAIYTLIQMGVATGTARTQYQRWYTAQKG